jgi:hypothetical protein
VLEAEGCEFVELTADEHAAFARAVKPVHDEARKRFGEEVFAYSKPRPPFASRWGLRRPSCLPRSPPARRSGASAGLSFPSCAWMYIDGEHFAAVDIFTEAGNVPLNT